ncbi:MAG: DUF370 domain-containing protein [Lachnospiraceae bacterium]|nr:DUF370 domain-containing protein [Lachnospiraceae bacterium]
MNCIINVGYGNMVNAGRVLGIIKPEAAPVRRMIQSLKDSGNAFDATCGRKTKSVLVLDNGCVMLSALLPETIAARMNNDYGRGEIIE